MTTDRNPKETPMPHKRQTEENQEVCGGGVETDVHYLINLTTGTWNAQSDNSPLALRAAVIYHGERHMTLSLHTPLTFINSPLRDTHENTNTQRFMTLKRRHSISHDTGTFHNLIFQAPFGRPRLLSPAPSIKSLWRVSVVRKDNFKMSRIQLIQFSRPPVCHY